MTQVFQNREKIGELSVIDTATVQLAASVITIGARQYTTSNLVLDTAVTGAGGTELAVAASTFYYVYAVVDSTVVKLIGSTSSIKPSAYSQYKLVGGFGTDDSSNIVDAITYRDGEFVEPDYEDNIEKLTGKFWIDGKPIYEISVSRTVANNDLIVSGVETMLEQGGSFNFSGVQWRVHPYGDGTLSSQFDFNDSTNEIRAFSSATRIVDAWVRYTKV